MSYRNPVRNVTVAQLAAAPVVRQTTTSGTSGGSSPATVVSPVDCVKGDVMILAAVSTSGSFTVDANWTSIYRDSVGNGYFALYRRPVVLADEGGAKSYTVGSAAGVVAAICAFGGVAAPTASAVTWAQINGNPDGSWQDYPQPSSASPGIFAVIPLGNVNNYPDQWIRWAPPAQGGPPTTPALDGGTLGAGGRSNNSSVNAFGSLINWSAKASYKLQMQRNAVEAGIATVLLKPAA